MTTAARKYPRCCDINLVEVIEAALLLKSTVLMVMAAPAFVAAAAATPGIRIHDPSCIEHDVADCSRRN